MRRKKKAVLKTPPHPRKSVQRARSERQQERDLEAQTDTLKFLQQRHSLTTRQKKSFVGEKLLVVL